MGGSSIPRDQKRPFSAPVRQLVANASDEQLAWIVGPDRKFYSREALEAATEELERRRAETPEPPTHTFHPPAFFLGPLWYFYHGMFGRGLLLLAVLIGALLGLRPVAEAIGIPELLWYGLVILGVGAYCAHFGLRDLAESETQARYVANKGRPREPERAGDDLVVVATVGCRAAGEQARALLTTEGIRAAIDGDTPTRVLVPPTSRQQSRELLSGLLEPLEARCDETTE